MDGQHLKVFGFAAYAHVAKDERHKLDPKTRKCIFLGYGAETKGYRLYDPERGRVFVSCDVIFDESVRGAEKSPSENPGVQKEPSVQIELHDDELTSDGANESVQPDQPAEPDQPSEPDQPVEAVVRRSQRERRGRPDYYGDWVSYFVSEKPEEPTTVKEALASRNRAQWRSAMEKEFESLHANKVWDVVELPQGRKAVGCKWVFKLKVDANGSVERYKARLVAQGFSQKFGLDYDKTFCPVVRFESLRTVIALAVQKGLKLHQMDVTTAFLNGELEKEVYMRQPEGFTVEGQEHLVCKLKRSIYGLKQSPRCWNSVLDGKLKKMGFVQTASDPCLYVSPDEMLIIAIYVDDILLAGESDERMDEVKQALSKQFTVKDMGELHYFLSLGVKILRDGSVSQKVRYRSLVWNMPKQWPLLSIQVTDLPRQPTLVIMWIKFSTSLQLGVFSTCQLGLDLTSLTR